MGQYFDFGYPIPDYDRPNGEGYEEARGKRLSLLEYREGRAPTEKARNI